MAIDILELLLDNSYDGLINLVINNQSVSLRKYCTLPIDNRIYFLLLPTTQIEGMEENELVILFIERNNFELRIVNSRKEFKLVYEHYLRLINH